MTKYTIRTLHNDIWGPTGLEVTSHKEAKEFAEWGYNHYKKYKIVEATKGNLTKYIKQKSKKLAVA